MKENSLSSKNTCYDAWLVRLPLFYVFMSGLGFSIQSLVVKILNEREGFDGSFQIVFARGIVQLVSSAYIIYFDEDRRAGKGPQLFGNTWFVRSIIAARAVVGYFGIAPAFLAVEYISIGDSTVLVMMSPVIAAIAGYFILGEPWRLPELLATILAITGGILVAKPPFIFGHHDSTIDVSASDYFFGVMYSLMAALGAGFAYVFVRMLGTTAKMPWANVTFSQAIAQIVMSIPNLYLFHEKVQFGVSWRVYAYITGGAMVGCLSQIAMTVGMQREKSAAASAMRTSDVVFGFIWQAVFTSDRVSMLSILGAILVTAGILLIVMAKQTDSPPPTLNEHDGTTEIELSPMQIQRMEVVQHGGSNKQKTSVKKSFKAMLLESLEKVTFTGRRGGVRDKVTKYSPLSTTEESI
ncbi:DMT family transporter [archaeon]|nr:MAG: DMT family transporter [archaeon]